MGAAAVLLGLLSVFGLSPVLPCSAALGASTGGALTGSAGLASVVSVVLGAVVAGAGAVLLGASVRLPGFGDVDKRELVGLGITLGGRGRRGTGLGFIAPSSPPGEVQQDPATGVNTRLIAAEAGRC